MDTVRLSHFSDILCVWAYAAERRMVELHEELGSAVVVDYRFVSVFGAGRQKLENRWRDKGGMAAYAEHVRDIITGFGHVALHPDAWARVAPASSWPAHLTLCAVRLLERRGAAPAGSFEALAKKLREAFFEHARDISRQDVVLATAAEIGLDANAITSELTSGSAHAELAADYDLAREQDVKMSPTILLNEARQRLCGNVGYRVIVANVREALEKRSGQASWC